MKKFILFFILLFLALVISSEKIQAQNDRSVFSALIASARKQPANTNWMLYFGRKLKGRPYVAHTLDKNKVERLVVNLRQLDCTTFVEQVVALRLCMIHHKYQYNDFCRFLQQIRYVDGNVAYSSRKHYFTLWIDNNQKNKIVRDFQSPNPPFSALQRLNIFYMSRHVNSYSMLKAHPEWLPSIRKMEQALTGRTYRYIPKKLLSNSKLLRSVIYNGDIIAILTNKKGLDTSHIGISVWHKDGLHLLNASSIHHKVVEEPMTLYRYMQKHPSQIGIRVCRVL